MHFLFLIICRPMISILHWRWIYNTHKYKHKLRHTIKHTRRNIERKVPIELLMNKSVEEHINLIRWKLRWSHNTYNNYVFCIHLQYFVIFYVFKCHSSQYISIYVFIYKNLYIMYYLPVCAQSISICAYSCILEIRVVAQL